MASHFDLEAFIDEATKNLDAYDAIFVRHIYALLIKFDTCHCHTPADYTKHHTTNEVLWMVKNVSEFMEALRLERDFVDSNIPEGL